MTPLLARLDAWLKKHRSRFHKNLQPGISPAELDALGKNLGKPGAAALAPLLTWHNGQGDDYVGYFVDHWLLMSADKIVAAKADLDATGGEYGWKQSWVPFFDDDGGNFIALDVAQLPAPVVAFWMGEKAETLAPSLEAWLSEFVTAVEAGKFLEDPERGTFTAAR